MLEYVSSPKAPAAIGPYSQAVKAGGFLYLSGMMPIDPATGALAPNEIQAQAEQIIRNIDGLLNDAGYCEADVVKTTCFLKNMSDFGTFNEIYGNYFTGKPARSCVAAAQLPKDVLAEVEIIAVCE